MNKEVDITFVDIYNKSDDNDTFDKNLLNGNKNKFNIFSNCCVNMCDCLFKCCFLIL
jgi:hypothetical protein